MVKDTERNRKSYPPELIMKSMLLMANGVPSSKVKANIIAVLAGTESHTTHTKLTTHKSTRLQESATSSTSSSPFHVWSAAEVTERYHWPDETTQRKYVCTHTPIHLCTYAPHARPPILPRWRFGMTHVCQVHIGMALTKAAVDKQQILTGDGTPVNGKHVECFVITTEDVKIAMLPWVQAGKGSELSANNTVKMIDACQRAYNTWYKKCPDKTGLPPPVKLGSLILNVAGTVNDHAANESARVGFLRKIKSRVAVELGDTSHGDIDLVDFYCNTHKGMLLAKALRKADHDFFSSLFPERDKGEFRTSNLLDTFEIQLSKMFGHHTTAYAFGNGVDKFPAWMKKKYPDRWRGIKRLVGNRAQIFLENAVIMYYMCSFYLEYTDFVLREAKEGNALHRRLDEKLRSAEMIAGLHLHTRHMSHARHVQVVTKSISHIHIPRSQSAGNCFYSNSATTAGCDEIQQVRWWQSSQAGTHGVNLAVSVESGPRHGA